MADSKIEQRHQEAANMVLTVIKRERAMLLSPFAKDAVANALADAEQRGAESAKAEAQPAGTGWVALLDAARGVISAHTNVYRDDGGNIIPREQVEGDSLRRLITAVDAFPHPCAAAAPEPRE